ncbi:formate dehydrogenase (NAD+) [Borealophlyctis nickersoniae]|nr:formate dehydrogenase (NAD+) [Borealophlyctis nickersoniae]
MKIVAVLYEGREAAAKEPRMLGCVEHALGLRDWLQSLGQEYIVTSKAGSELDELLVDADVLITTPFHPAYITRERMDRAKKLKLCVTAGVGSDHIDLDAANEKGITVAEVTGSNVVSVAEQVIMTMLVMVRNFVPAHEQAVKGEWDVAQIAAKAFDLEGKIIGTIGAGRIGRRVLERLKPFDPKELLYSDYQDMPEDVQRRTNARRVDLHTLIRTCDVITVNAPLNKSTRGLINKDIISQMKDGVYIINTARGAIVDREAIREACESGKVAGYGGDVWDVQPAPPDHPWRTMPNNAMTPHYSGTTIDAQLRYAAGVKEILNRFFNGDPLNPQDVIVQGGKYASAAYVYPPEE